MSEYLFQAKKGFDIQKKNNFLTYISVINYYSYYL